LVYKFPKNPVQAYVQAQPRETARESSKQPKRLEKRKEKVLKVSRGAKTEEIY
jgi:hypothetical protein